MERSARVLCHGKVSGAREADFEGLILTFGLKLSYREHLFLQIRELCLAVVALNLP